MGFKFLNARKKGVLNQSDCQKRSHFSIKCQKILKIMPNLFHSNVLFYLDGVLFVCKRNPLPDDEVLQRVRYGGKGRRGYH